eukprot:1911663-Amphidinium_carterae.1
MLPVAMVDLKRSVSSCSDASLGGGCVVSSSRLVPNGERPLGLARCVPLLVTWCSSPEACRCVKLQWPDAAFSAACSLESIL